MLAPLVRMVVCTHNNRAIVDACLESLKAQTYTARECVVVDDASTDGTADWVRRHHPWVTVLQNSTNRGPAYSRNFAVSGCGAEYVAFFDSDVQLDRRWLEEAVKAFAHDETIGMVGGKLLLATCPDRVHSYGGTLSRIGVGWHTDEWREHAALDQPVECLWISSAALLMRRALLQRIGGFDETFFYGYEDSDLGWRARLLGYRAVCIPEAVAYHGVNQTVETMGDLITFHACKNRLRSMLKNYALGSLVKYLPMYLLYSVADIVLRPSAIVKLHAWYWNAAMLADTLRKRAEIQRTRTARDAEIAPLFSARFVTPASIRHRRRLGAHGAQPR